jgi:hypothetical protein
MHTIQHDLFGQPVLPRHPRRVRRGAADPAQALREALAPYVDTAALPALIAAGSDLSAALYDLEAPETVRRLLVAFTALLHPAPRAQIKSPADVAALLMVEALAWDQEHLRVVLLDSKNRVQAIHTVYIGSLNSALIRIGEVFKEALKRNSAAIILTHNHPSGAPRSA